MSRFRRLLQRAGSAKLRATDELKQRISKIIATLQHLVFIGNLGFYMLRSLITHKIIISILCKDVHALEDHPDDEECDDASSSAATDTLSELSDGTVQYVPTVESLKDKRLQRIAEQMLAGLSEVSKSKDGVSEPKVPDPDVSEEKSKDLVAMGDQLKIMMEKAQMLHDSKRDTRPLPKQELPAHVAWIFPFAFF